MTPKQEINDSFDLWLKNEKAFRLTIDAISKDTRYAAEYRNELINQKKAEMAAARTRAFDAMVYTVQKVKTWWQGQLAAIEKAKASGEYQARFSNTIRTIELNGKRLEKEFLREIATPFARDLMARAAFEGALISTSYEPMNARDLLDTVFGAAVEFSKLGKRLDGLTKLIEAIRNDKSLDTNKDAFNRMDLDMALDRWNDELTEHDPGRPTEATLEGIQS